MNFQAGFSRNKEGGGRGGGRHTHNENGGFGKKIVKNISIDASLGGCAPFRIIVTKSL